MTRLSNKTGVSCKSDNVSKFVQKWYLSWEEGHTFPASWKGETSNILVSDI